MVKAKVDHLDDDHLKLLDEILNVLVIGHGLDAPVEETKGHMKVAEWRAFLDKFVGCMKGTPIKRQPQSDVGPQTNLAEFLRDSPLSRVELNFEREKD